MPRTPPRAVSRIVGGAEWTPIIDGPMIVMVTISAFTFFYFSVGYRFFPEFYQPSMAMLMMMTTGLFLGFAFTQPYVYMTGFNVSMAGISLACLTMILALEGLFGSIPQGVVRINPQAGLVVELNPFWLILFYFSVGVAEECAFTFGMFSPLAKMNILGTPWLPLVFKTLAFVGYHQFVAIQIFGQGIYKVLSYSLSLYFGSMLMTVAYYYTRRISIPALTHGSLNAIIQAISIGVLQV